MSILIE